MFYHYRAGVNGLLISGTHLALLISMFSIIMCGLQVVPILTNLLSRKLTLQYNAGVKDLLLSGTRLAIILPMIGIIICGLCRSLFFCSTVAFTIDAVTRLASMILCFQDPTPLSYFLQRNLTYRLSKTL